MSAAARQPLLEVDALEVELGGGGIGATPPARVLTGVDLSLQAGEIVGLIGETGSGKTTLARTIVGLHEPAAGEVRFDGEPISRLGRRARREFRRRGDIQFVFQSPLRSLDPDMRIGEIVAEGLTIGRRPARADLERRVAAALTKVGLDPALMSRRPATISGGQRQRVAIARAIATDPRLIVFDEPVSALDASSRNYILKVLLELRESLGIAILVISHDMSSITEVADRVLVLYHGSLVEDGPLPGTFEQPQHPYTALLIASTPAAVRRDGRYDVPPAAALRLPVGSDVVPENGCPYAPRCPFATEICRAVAPDRTEPRPAQTVRCHHAPTWRAHTEQAPSAV